MNKTSIRT